MIISLVPPAYLQTCLKYIEPLMLRAVETTNGRSGIKDLINDIVAQDQFLWVCFEIDPIVYYAICTIKIIQYPNRRMISGIYVAGDHMDKWRDPLLDTLEKFAKDQNCDGIEMTGRYGWKRVLADRGWKTDFCLYERDLREGKT